MGAITSTWRHAFRIAGEVGISTIEAALRLVQKRLPDRSGGCK